MKLEQFIRYDRDAIRNMSHEEVFKLHKDLYICPEGLDYLQVVKRYRHMMKVLGINLTSEQLNFVLSCQHGIPVIAEACPGSGKTTVSQFVLLADRIIHGVNPQKMLMTSFSQESSQGMQNKNEQFAKRMGVPPVGKVKTMHAWYYAFLQEYLKELELPRPVDNLIVLDSAKVNNRLKSAYMQVTGDNYPTSNLLSQLLSLYCFIYDSMIDHDKHEIMTLELFNKLPFAKDAKTGKTDLDQKYGIVMQIFEKFTNSKRFMGELDFTDMQVLFLELLEKRQDIRERIANHFDLILIDEAQDTSKLQLRIYALLISENNRRRFRIIGDIDQSIYRWRGTSKTPFEDFFEIFDDGQLCTLGYNMRSGMGIIEPANRLIRHTKHRVDKNMTTIRDIESRVEVIPSYSKLDAVESVYRLLKDAYRKIGSNYKLMEEHCVLVRNNNQALWLVDRLLTERIPVKLVGSNFPYNDKIFRDMLIILKAVLNPSDPQLGSQALPKLCKDITNARSSTILMQMNMGKKLYEIEFDLVRNRNAATNYAQDVERIKQACELRRPTVSSLCEILIPMYRTGSYDYYAEKQSIEPEHYELIFDYLLELDIPVNAFDTKLTTIQRQLDYNNDMDLGFRVCTMHGSKGREYENVYLLDCSDTTCPDIRKMERYDPAVAYDYLIEERNLWYVAMTRAIKNLYITYNAKNPSLFMLESDLIKEEHKKYVKPIPSDVLIYEDSLDNLKYCYGDKLKPKPVKPVKPVKQTPAVSLTKPQLSPAHPYQYRLNPSSHILWQMNTELSTEYKDLLNHLNYPSS